MDRRTPPGAPSPMAGGAPLALAIIAGVLIGGAFGQPSIGLLVGLATGIAIALLIWRRGTRRDD